MRDIAGQRFGRLTAIRLIASINARPHWLCKCDCGNHVVVLGKNLESGKYNTCGCHGKEMGLIANSG